MSDPYNQYPPQQQPPYGYPPQQGGYEQYGQQQQQPPYPQHGYPQYQPSYNEEPGYGPPQRTNSFGPPQAGGFQHGQQGSQFGAYDASNPQGHAGYYGGPPPPGTLSQDYHSLHQNPPYHDPSQGYNEYSQQQPPYQPIPNDSNNPNAAAAGGPEGERGLGGAIAGGFLGRIVGKNAKHSKLGMIGGAIVGSKVEDKFKDKKHHGGGGHYGQGYHGSSSWGGGRW